MTKDKNTGALCGEALCLWLVANDDLISSVCRDLARGYISEAAAIYSLRGAGLSEPDIADILEV